MLFLWALGLLAVVLLGARYLHHDKPPAAAPIHVAEPGGGASSRLLVHVAGAGRRPGGYRLAAGARGFGAGPRAGGAGRPAAPAAPHPAPEPAGGGPGA